jgi:hypothetical protein
MLLLYIIVASDRTKSGKSSEKVPGVSQVFFLQKYTAKIEPVRRAEWMLPGCDGHHL